MLLATFTLYEAFSMAKSYDTDEKYHEITDTSLTPTVQNHNITFNTAGVKQMKSYSLTNNAAAHYSSTKRKAWSNRNRIII